VFIVNKVTANQQAVDMASADFHIPERVQLFECLTQHTIHECDEFSS